MSTLDDLKTDLEKARLGFHIEDACKKHLPHLMEKKASALKASTASLTSVEPAAGQFYRRAVQLKAEIVNELDKKGLTLRELQQVKPWLVPQIP